MCTSIVKGIRPFSGTKEDVDDVIGTAYGKGCLRKLKKICAMHIASKEYAVL